MAKLTKRQLVGLPDAIKGGDRKNKCGNLPDRRKRTRSKLVISNAPKSSGRNTKRKPDATPTIVKRQIQAHNVRAELRRESIRKITGTAAQHGGAE